MDISSQEIGYLKIVEESVDVYLKSKVTMIPQSQIGATLVRILPKVTPGMKFTVLWEDKKKPFIMAIRPNLDELDKKSKELVDLLNDPKKGTMEYLNKWCEIKNWELFIDPRILTKGHPLCVSSGSEFVAVLCHEIGHVLSKDPIEFVNSYRENMLVVSKAEKMAMSENPIVRSLILPMFVHTQTFKIILKKDLRSQKDEMIADDYIPSEYRGAFVSYVEDHILTTPEARTNIVISKEEYKSEQKTGINFSRSTIDLMKHRKDVIKRQIHAQYHHPDDDNYYKRLMKKMGLAIGKYDPDNGDSSLLSESAAYKSFQWFDNKINMEATAILESTKVTDRELTILEIEANSIKTSEDKLWVIQTIYDYLEAISKQQSDKLKKLKKNGASEREMKSITDHDTRVTRLTTLRNKVMAMDVESNDSNYGIYINYPKGYEG